MKEVFKMSPLFTGNQNPNIRRMSDDSVISLLGSNGDFSSISNSSIRSIFEETAIRENKYLSKITKLLGKNITFIVALSGNITAQMIISTTVAKTPLNAKLLSIVWHLVVCLLVVIQLLNLLFSIESKILKNEL